MHDSLSRLLDEQEREKIERYTQNGFYLYVQTRSILAPINYCCNGFTPVPMNIPNLSRFRRYE